MKFKGYFATKSGHLYYTDGKIVQLKSGKPECRMLDMEEHKIQDYYICDIGRPALFFFDADGIPLHTSNIVARYPIE